VETLLLLLAYKWMLPDRFFMLRGNHEVSNHTSDIRNMLAIKCLVAQFLVHQFLCVGASSHM
jgi:hypothetical protein